ncbi:MAG: hypothetical protein Fur0044_05820 [Anaerolineae bacterium]
MAAKTPEANDSPSPRSHLFTVRVWLEELSYGQTEWRGQVQHVLSGKSRYFRNWASLLAFLQEMVSGDGAGSQDETTTNNL